MPKVLIVEDDIELGDRISEWLQFEKFSVDLARTGGDAGQFLDTYKYDLIVLDWQLPDTTGIEICREFRGKGGMTPVLFLTGKNTITDKEHGFDSGADDYLTKPFHLKELSMRLRALLKRAPVVQNETIACQNLTLQTGTFKVTNEGKAVQLLPKEYALLEYLLKHPNQVFSSKALLDAVWESDSNASEDTIRTYIKTLRRKITPESGDCPIKTIHGLGYKIDCP